MIQVTFNKPVVFSTLSAADLTFTSAPAGVTVNVGAPIAVDNPTDPTIVDFPISFTKAAGVTGQRQLHVHGPEPGQRHRSSSEDGKDLVAVRPDHLHPRRHDRARRSPTPRSAAGPSRSSSARRSTRPRSTLGNIFVLRKGGAAAWPPNAGDLSQLHQPQQRSPRHDQLQPADLHGDARLQQPAPDRDAIGRLRDRGAEPATPGRPGVTDLVGNPLDGNFNGSFPTTADPAAARTTSSRTSASRRSRPRRSRRSR